MAKVGKHEMDAVDGWALGHITGLILMEAERPSSVFERVAIMTNDDGTLKPDEITIQVAGRSFVLSIRRTDEVADDEIDAAEWPPKA